MVSVSKNLVHTADFLISKYDCYMSLWKMYMLAIVVLTFVCISQLNVIHTKAVLKKYPTSKRLNSKRKLI